MPTAAYRPILRAIVAMWFAFALVTFALLIVATRAWAASCELTDVRGLTGWSPAAQAYWTRTVLTTVSGRVEVFLISGKFEPKTFSLNGNTAGVTSGTFERVKSTTERSESDKVCTGHIEGTEICTYEIKSDARRDSEETVRFHDVSFRIPYKISDLPNGARETILVSGQCVSSGVLNLTADTRKRTVVRRAIKAEFGP